MPLDPRIKTALAGYTTCDVSDALLKLHVPSAGFLPDLTPYIPIPSDKFPLIAPISTVTFQPIPVPINPAGVVDYTPIEKGGHFADEVPVEEGGIVLLGSQVGYNAERDINALLGGLVGLRIKIRGAAAVIVDGRVRDLPELREGGLGVWAKGTSTVGAGGGHKALGCGGIVKVGRVEVRTGDVGVVDEGGLVIIPKEMVGKVLEMLPGIVGADDKVREDVKAGVQLSEAFRKHRGKL